MVIVGSRWLDNSSSIKYCPRAYFDIYIDYHPPILPMFFWYIVAHQNSYIQSTRPSSFDLSILIAITITLRIKKIIIILTIIIKSIDNDDSVRIRDGIMNGWMGEKKPKYSLITVLWWTNFKTINVKFKRYTRELMCYFYIFIITKRLLVPLPKLLRGFFHVIRVRYSKISVI